jgi:hypothetical protein
MHGAEDVGSHSTSELLLASERFGRAIRVLRFSSRRRLGSATVNHFIPELIYRAALQLL